MTNTLWFPEGVEKGDVVYDLKNRPHLVGDKVVSGGVNIRTITRIAKDEAETLISKGAQKIISE